jgi:hypothetical protein
MDGIAIAILGMVHLEGGKKRQNALDFNILTR